MLSRPDHRRARLRELIDATCKGVIRVYAERIGRDPTYISRLLYATGKPGGRNIGDEIAEVTEREFGLVRGWFDLPEGAQIPGAEANQAPPSKPSEATASWPFEKVTRSQWESLSPLQKEHVEATVLLFLQPAPLFSSVQDQAYG